MKRAVWLVVIAGCKEGPATPLGVTLDDGQVLIGDITTDVVVLEGALGVVEIPLDDIGMIVPVEGRTLGDSGGNVTVWLRNGSELRGDWAEPELSVGLLVGGARVAVDVPTDRMQALQLQGSESWPTADLFRVRTTWGDDFLVDPAATRITLENELGTFAPFLAECASIAPIGAPDGDWRIELLTGTVLVGPLREPEIAFGLPMGPEVLTVPLDRVVSLDRSTWADGQHAPEEAAPAAAEPALRSDQGWFDNRRMESAKR